MRTALQKSSMVRQMFEEGIKLKLQYGKDAVFDYSLGNPDLPPPASFKKALFLAATDERPGVHGYMPNAGIPEVRDEAAKYLTETHWDELNEIFYPGHVVMTIGAAGALNCAFKAILDPGDEVLALAPYFMEYAFYADNHGGVLRVAETDRSFRPDPQKVWEKITPKTKALLINTPTNPTGAVYTADELKSLGEVLAKAEARFKREILLISDEPYRKLVFGGKKAPSVFAAHPNTISCTSFSKDLSIPGERLGYLAVSPKMRGGDEAAAAIILANRILGGVNAPALAQRAVEHLFHGQANLGAYEERAGFLAERLLGMGYLLTRPEGAFYLFPQSPIPDDLVFTSLLREENILAVPGEGFCRPGHFRLSLCLDLKMIEKSLGGFSRALEKARLMFARET
jgi:aspartate aminotransferase